MSTEETADGGWRPKATIGPVPRRVDRYRLNPVSLPTRPVYATDPTVQALGRQLLDDVMVDIKQGVLKDPWQRHYAFRHDPAYSTLQKVRRAFPGFGIAAVAFGIYLGLEYVGVIPSSSSNDHHHSH